MLYPIERHTIVFLFALLLMAPQRLPATAVEDRSQATLSAAATPVQRIRALLALAEQRLDQDPIGAYTHAQDAVILAQRQHDRELEHEALLGLAEMEERLGLFEEVLQSTLKAVALAQALSSPALIAQDLQLVSKAYLHTGEPEKAESEARKALAMSLPTADHASIAEARRCLMRTLLHSGAYAELWKVAWHGIDLARTQKDSLEEARFTRLLGASLLAQGKLNDARTYLVAAEGILSRSGTSEERFWVQCDLVRTYLKQGHPELAAPALEAAAAFLHDADRWSTRLRYADLEYQLAKTSGDWEGAVNLLQRIKDRSDSTYTAILNLRSRYAMRAGPNEHGMGAQVETAGSRQPDLAGTDGLAASDRMLIGAVVILLVLLIAIIHTNRQNKRLARRMSMKNTVIKRQHDEIHAKNLELKRQNMRLTETLMSEEEKEVMLKEIHHRVKNDLQVVDSLLRIQAIEVADPRVDRVLKEAQGRIRAMAMVHEHMYRNSGGASAGLQHHFEQLARNILVAHGAHDRISIRVQAPLPSFGTDTMMPLTLLVNELCTNAVKHAFPSRESGRITIGVRKAEEGYELSFSDDGVGTPVEGPNLNGERPFGMQLVHMLAEQLNGELRQHQGTGTTICLTFAPEPTQMRLAS